MSLTGEDDYTEDDSSSSIMDGTDEINEENTLFILTTVTT